MPPAFVSRPPERALERSDLLRRQALAGVVRAARELVDVERLLTRRERADDAVLRAVERVALREHGARDDLHIVARERVLGIVVRLPEALDVPGMLERGLRQVEARIAREEAVELAREPRRAHHRVPAAV